MKIKLKSFPFGLLVLILSLVQFNHSLACGIVNYQTMKVQIDTSFMNDTVPPANVVAIGLDKMNVFYIGVDNPITIAIAGIETKNVIVSINNGTITGSNGKYIVRVTKPEETVIKVGNLANGKNEFSGEYSFRVKEIPNPVNGKIPWDMDAKAAIK